MLDNTAAPCTLFVEVVSQRAAELSTGPGVVTWCVKCPSLLENKTQELKSALKVCVIKVCWERRGRREKGTKSSKYSLVNVENLSVFFFS